MGRKALIMSLLALAVSLGAGGAAASDIRWVVDVRAPVGPGVSLGTVVSNAPVYRPRRVVYQPVPVVYRPVVYRPVPVYRPQVVYRPVYVPYRAAERHHQCRHQHRQHRRDRDDDDDD